MKERFQKNLFWPSFLIAVASILLAIGIQLYAALEADRASFARDQTLVENGMASRIAEKTRRPIAVTWWDDTVLNIDNQFNAEWVHTNVGRFLAETEGFDASVVLDRDDKALYAMRDGEQVDVETAAALQQAATPLVALAREAERKRGSVEKLLAAEKLSQPIFFSAVSKVGDELHIITAHVTQPDRGTALPLTDRAPVLIASERMNAKFMEAFTELFLLADPQIEDGVAVYQPGRTAIPLKDSQGAVVATLTWSPPTAGAALLRKSLPTTLLLIAFLSIVAWLLYRKGREATRNLIASEARASHMAAHDVLTGLPNRTALAERLAYALDNLRRTGQPFAIHCIDLDRFKEINDSHGHAAGDELLRVIAQRLSAVCADKCILARLGGDEFAIIQRDADHDAAATFAQIILQSLSEPIDLPTGQVFSGCSIGTTLVDNGTIDGPECMRQADLALYRAKDTGRGRLAFFEPEMDAALRLRRGLQADLRRALENDEIWLAYQPQVNHHGKMLGVEALVRWRHPERGDIAPSLFVPLAEESGLIEVLGMKVLERAFADSLRFGDLTLAVNISASQLRAPTFVPRLLLLVAQTPVDPRQIELEITEGLLLGDDAQTHESLQRLRDVGFRIALDDFGTGYSSLSYLRRYPIDKIKIDRSFITNIEADDDAQAVISAIVNLAKALSLSVIAEGVETDAQCSRLAALSCTTYQGFLFGKPVTAEEIERVAQNQLGAGHSAARRRKQAGAE